MHVRRKTSFVIPLVGLFGITPMVLLIAQDEEKESSPPVVYKGNWVNRKMRTSGPLQCTMKESDDSEWSARFEGKFKGDPFKYEVKFDAKKSKAKTDLKGKAMIDGDPYEWIGSIKGDTLTVRYLSAKGYNGEFKMKKSAAKKKPEKAPKSK